MNRYLGTALAGCLGLTLLASAAVAETYVASTWLPQSYELSSQGYADTFDRIREKSGGALNFEIHYSGALLPPRTTLSGVKDGVAHVGIVYPPYTPAEVPLSNFLNSASFLSDDSLVAALAWTELNFTSDALKAEWQGRGVVFGGGYATPVYSLLCNTQVVTLDQVRGKRFRTASTAHSELVSELGGSPVSVPIGDAYSGMQRGSLECAVADATNLVSASFNEVVKHITLAPLGVVIGATWVYNADFWANVSTGERALLLDEMALGIIRTQTHYANNVASALKDAEDRGIQISEPDADLQASIQEYKTKYLQALIAAGAGNLDASEAKALIGSYLNTQEKWASLLEGVDRNDENAILAIIKENLLSQLDPASYGM